MTAESLGSFLEAFALSKLEISSNCRVPPKLEMMRDSSFGSDRGQTHAQ
jgi:hypothetical protein